jgi:hypothetical protein
VRFGAWRVRRGAAAGGWLERDARGKKTRVGDGEHDQRHGERRSHHELQRHVLRHRRQRDNAGAEREDEDEVDEGFGG